MTNKIDKKHECIEMPAFGKPFYYCPIVYKSIQPKSFMEKVTESLPEIIEIAAPIVVAVGIVGSIAYKGYNILHNHDLE